ncbi:molybdopterin biosynthesis protein [Thermocladium modestius]|uniref:molybdopterin biosynthesis protein n=1 Tax=Thermocladium modestius TaxID=62609 RepID=UPI001E4E009C|nr:molybdopterin biosynthesis protein [Thermocladium modestius]
MKRVIFHNLLTPEEALNKLLGYVRVLDAETVDIEETYMRVLAADVYSNMDVPPFDRATMDGYAVRAEDTFNVDELHPARLKLVGGINAGDVPNMEVTRGTTAEIATGAPMPKGANAVIPVEYTKAEGREVVIYRSATPTENVMSAGSDIMMGELVLRACTQVREREAGVLASIGMRRVPVIRRPRVAIVSTGDELVDVGGSLGPGKIYDVNAHSISHAVRESGGVPVLLGIAGDDEGQIREMIMKGLDADLVLVSGGTSAGVADITYRVLDSMGPPGIVIHGLKVKPGKPTVAAVTSGGKLVIGLPGYPNSSLMIFNLLVKPLLSAMQCYPLDTVKIKARLANKAEGARGRRALTPVSLVDVGNQVLAYPLPAESGAISTLAFADGFMEVPENVEFMDKGDEVTVTLFTHEYKPANLYFVGSHDLGIDIMARLLPKWVTVKVINVGSLNGLMAASNEETDVAGLHLIDEESGEYNLPFVEKYGKGKVVLIRGYSREQGIIIPKGNPKGIRGIRDLLRSDVSIVNRNKGAGTRFLLDSLLKRIAAEDGVSFNDLMGRINGYYYEVRTHTAVAAAVSQGKADAGVGIRAAAHMYGLDFIPLSLEKYDFAVPRSRLAKDSVKAFIEMLKSPSFQNELSRLPGYKVSEDIGNQVPLPS